MATMNRTVAALRIFGDDLVPGELTEQLGCSPTMARTKGEEIKGNAGVRIAKTGAWHFEASEKSPGDLDAQISEIFSSMSADLNLWRTIGAKYQVDLFCGLFMKGSNEGLSLSTDSLNALGSRGVEIGLDIYGELNDA